VVLLVANQELVPVGSRAELRHAIAAALDEVERLTDHPPRIPSRVRPPHERRRAEAIGALRRALKIAPEPARERIERGIEALGGHPNLP